MPSPAISSALRRATCSVGIIGGGMGGLNAALYLASAGLRVSLFEKASEVGGKARNLPSEAGPVAAGPTVLTLRDVFDASFANVGKRLDDVASLTRQTCLARHYWPDGSALDLVDDHDENAARIATFAGRKAEAEFRRFHAETHQLFEAFEAPMMRQQSPSALALAGVVARRPNLVGAMAPWRNLARHLQTRFSDPRLAQLFGRYATYVGGSPTYSPALLSLIWQAEARGVWTIEGGIAALAKAMAREFEALGGQLRLSCGVTRMDARSGGWQIHTEADTAHHVDLVLFNGDPRALRLGALGPDAVAAAPGIDRVPRSLSARVWSFAAQASGVNLAHHNVFFASDTVSEFDDLAKGRMPVDPTLYVCAQDRGQPDKTPKDGDLERFEIILNAPPLERALPVTEEKATCYTRTFPVLEQRGLSLNVTPALAETGLTVPSQFDTLFPHSNGSLYGQCPHGLTSSLKRPRARTPVRGLYLCGGGTHPGAGVPMAALSGQHAAEAILTDLGLTLPSRQTDTPGGTLTGSVRMANARSL